MGIQINGQTDTVTAIDGSINIGGNVTVPGVLTYDDVTNIDAIGIITARSGIVGNVTGNVTGDLTGNVTVGTGATIGGTADTIIASTGGSEVFRANSNQTLHVGGSTSLYKLQVTGAPQSTNNFGILHIRDSQTLSGAAGTGGIFFSSSPGTDYYIAKGYDGSNTALKFGNANNGTEYMSIDYGGRVTKPNQPAFMAYGNTGNTHVSGSDVIYPTAGINVGGHYDTSNGLFTAPVAGIYHFAWSSIGNTTDDVYRFYIRVNGGNIYGDYHLRQDTTETGSAYADNADKTVLVNLNANDNVRIHYSSGGANFYPGGNSTSNYYLSFSGYLIA